MSKEPFKPIDDLPPLPTTEYLTPAEMLPHIEPGDTLPFGMSPNLLPLVRRIASSNDTLRHAEKAMADALLFLSLVAEMSPEFTARYDSLNLRSQLSAALAKVREELK